MWFLEGHGAIGALDSVITALGKVSDAIFKWFNDNQMQASAIKCHVLISTDQKVYANVVTTQIWNSKSVKLLGVNIGSKLNFDKHIKIICGKSWGK